MRSNALFPPRWAPLAQNRTHTQPAAAVIQKSFSEKETLLLQSQKKNSTGRRCCVPITANKSELFWLAVTFLVIPDNKGKASQKSPRLKNAAAECDHVQKKVSAKVREKDKNAMLKECGEMV